MHGGYFDRHEMKIFYVTDLHGCRWKYDRLADLAAGCEADVVINGGDMLPNHGRLYEFQGEFIRSYLPLHFERFSTAGIPYLCCLGNDDLGVYDSLFDETCRRYPGIHNIAQTRVPLGGHEFVGFNLTVDYPFRLKDRCRIDTKDYLFQRQLGTALFSRPGGFEECADWVTRARHLPTLAEELRNLVKPRHPPGSIYVMHMPPAGLGLDVCGSGFRAGSRAVRDFLMRMGPLLSLHGHIHESPAVSGVWRAQLGSTLCVQPGQDGNLVAVVVDIPAMRAERLTLVRGE